MQFETTVASVDAAVQMALHSLILSKCSWVIDPPFSSVTLTLSPAATSWRSKVSRLYLAFETLGLALMHNACETDFGWGSAAK
jgi:hypothetical protein